MPGVWYNNTTTSPTSSYPLWYNDVGTGSATNSTNSTWTITTTSSTATTTDTTYSIGSLIITDGSIYVPAPAVPQFVPIAPAILRYRPSRIDRHEERRLQAEQARQQERQRSLENLRRIERQKPITRAHGLLLSQLTPEQRQSIEQHGWFLVIGGKSGQRYRINARNDNLVGNVHALDGDKVSHRLCAHLAHGLPFGDHLLAQKLMLENAEEDFLRIANRHAA